MTLKSTAMRRFRMILIDSEYSPCIQCAILVLNELFSTATLTAAENTLSENVWTYVFQDIPKYNKDGEAAVYSIKEFPAN